LGILQKFSLEVSTTCSRQHVFTACVPKYFLLSQPPTHVVAQRGGKGKVLDLAVESKRNMKSFQVPCTSSQSNFDLAERLSRFLLSRGTRVQISSWSLRLRFNLSFWTNRGNYHGFNSTIWLCM
jgi:hypothetical protein